MSFDKRIEKARQFMLSPLDRALQKFENANLSYYNYEGNSNKKTEELRHKYEEAKNELKTLFQYGGWSI